MLSKLFGGSQYCTCCLQVSLWKRAQALIMSVWAWLVSAVQHRFGGSSKPRMA